MTLDDLDQLLLKVGSTLTDFNKWPCLSAYEDVLHTSALSADIESGMSALSLAELAAGPDAEQRRHFEAHARLITLLKAMYFFGATFVDAVIIAATSAKQTSLIRFLDAATHVPLERLNLSEVLPAYAVCVFRHKFVAHQNLPRFMISELRPGGPVRLTPTRSGGATFPPDEVVSLARLRSQFSSSVQGMTANPYEDVSALFYGTPIGRLGGRAQERKEIDRIAEKTLCGSLDRLQVVAALDRFVRAVGAAVS